jgi:hypothetical protein
VPANTTPIFTLVPIIGRARISTANASRDGTGTLGTIVTGATDGTRIDRIIITATVSTTAGMIRLFINDGTNIRAFREVPVTVITVGASTPAFTATIISPDTQAPLLVLPSGYILAAGTHNAESFDVLALGGAYS